MNHVIVWSEPLDEWLKALRQEAASHYQQTKRPLVTLSFAQSLDGSIAAKPGAPTALSGPQAMEFTHKLRSVHQAILVGIGTILADNPRLTNRLASGPSPQPVILDRDLRFPLGARVMEHPSLPWIFTKPGAPEEKAGILIKTGARLFEAPLDPGCGGPIQGVGNSRCGLDLENILEQLGKAGIQSLMVEGGAQVITSFLMKKLVDWAAITIAPVFLGGLRAIVQPEMSTPLLSTQSGFPKLVEMKVTRLGEDILVWGQVQPSS